ncbi:hypothetical protein D5085_15365 [Ectothiorhodospiraceae bacterium BW-2]|nr:hypothetical protein D5085_15365 [Ectothiorhodospiraceae bacterium BW-2]
METINELEMVVALCEAHSVEAGIEPLVAQLNDHLPHRTFKYISCRGEWYRLGGVVDRGYRPVAAGLRQWLEQEISDDNLELFLERYLDAGYFVTKWRGQSYYLNAVVGERAEEFLQLEIEQLQQVLDRPLLDPDWLPDTVEELIDPLDFPHLEPEPLGEGCFRFRRLTPIRGLLSADERFNTGEIPPLQRLFSDWDRCSGRDVGHFSDFWVVVLHDGGEAQGSFSAARPQPARALSKESLNRCQTLKGSELANALHQIDYQLGHPFSWYFALQLSHIEPSSLIEQVLEDHAGEYAYIPERDLVILRDWMEEPYSC